MNPGRSHSIRCAVVVVTAWMLPACAPVITNQTPGAYSRTMAGSYPMAVNVDPRRSSVFEVAALVDGHPWPLANVAGTQRWESNYLAHPCATVVPYALRVRYHQAEIFGSGYSAAVSEMRAPPVGGYVVSIMPGATPAGCPSTYGRIFTVTTDADGTDVDAADGQCRTESGGCSLRAAVMQANAMPGHDRIDVPPGTYRLTLTGTETMDTPDPRFGDLDVTDAVSIVGSSTAAVVVDGNGTSRLFDVYAMPNGAFVQVVNATLTNGREQGKPGGAVLNRGVLQIERVRIAGNRLSGSEGAGTCGNNIALRQCNRGAGIFNEGTLAVTESTVRENSTCDSTTGGCGAPTGQGGALANHGGSARALVERSLLVNNGARFVGGVINFQGAVEIVNSTIGDHIGGWAVAVLNRDGQVRIKNVTITTSVSGVPVLGVAGAADSMSLQNSLVMIDSWSGGTLCSGSLSSGGFNEIGGPASHNYLTGCTLTGFAATSRRLSVGSLRANGGPTETIALFPRDPSSTSYDPIDKGGIDCPATDQRGVTRSFDGDGDGKQECDPGAFEYGGR